MQENDAPPSLGEKLGRIIATTVILVFLIAATAGFRQADRHLSARVSLYDEALAKVEEMPDPSTPSPSWEGRLVRATGEVHVPEGAEDPLFGVRANAVCIKREVEYYQWREVERSRNGTRSANRRYDYVKRWMPYPVDSTRFRRQAGDRFRNPPPTIMPTTTPAAQAMLGGYELTDAVKSAFPDGEPLPFSLNAPQRRIHQTDNNAVYFGADPNHPEIGDMRVRLTAVPPGPASVIAQVKNGKLDEFTAENGQRLTLVRMGGDEAALTGLSLANRAGWWGIRLGLALAYGLLFRFLSLAYGWRGVWMFYLGAAVACCVMFALWWLDGGFRIGWGMAYLVAAAAAAGVAVSKKQ